MGGEGCRAGKSSGSSCLVLLPRCVACMSMRCWCGLEAHGLQLHLHIPALLLNLAGRAATDCRCLPCSNQQWASSHLMQAI